VPRRSRVEAISQYRNLNPIHTLATSENYVQLKGRDAMIGFARFTAIIFMLLGLIILLAGGGIVANGFINPPTPAPTAPSLVPNLSGLMSFAGIIAGGVAAFQGLLLAAVGQALWLLASMANQSQLNTEYMAELVRRMGNASRG
jgi:hypothetical protein